MKAILSMKTMLCSLMISLLLAGCAASGDSHKVQVVDGSSVKSTVHSLRMMKGQSIATHCQIEAAVKRILVGDPTLAPANGNGLGEKLDGMTSEQVVKFSEMYPPLTRDQIPNRGNCTP